jgi:hypothetical protein
MMLTPPLCKLVVIFSDGTQAVLLCQVGVYVCIVLYNMVGRVKSWLCWACTICV